MKKYYLLFISTFLLPVLLSAQSVDKVNSLLDRWNEDHEFMGEILILKNKEPLLHRHLGYKNMDKEMLHDDESTFAVGEITQTFTAALVLMAVDENKLQLENTIETYFPKLPNSNRITIRHLLEHRSGLADYTEYLPAYQNPSIATNMDKLINPMEVSELKFQPGQRHQLVNTNYLMLSYILEKAYGMDFQALLEDKITGPKQLNNTFLTAVSTTKLRSKSSGHHLIGNDLSPQPATHPLFTAGSGGISSTASDLGRFSQALFNEDLLPRQSLEMMKPKAANEDYGMGLSESTVAGKRAFGHEGSSNGFQSSFLYFPEEMVTMIVLMNRASANFEGMIEELGISYFGAAPLPDVEEFPEASPADLPTAAPATTKPAAAAVITGTYAFNPKLKITVFREGGELKAQTANQPATTLVKEGPYVYKIRGTEGKIRFVLEDDVVTHLLFEQTGFQQKAVKE
ncbi:MAG TPA: serine hydrolase domain-containing protein [Anditalea sp.]|nr:serine hydrolase domain-containing protein [Anditalea sp.]